VDLDQVVSIRGERKKSKPVQKVKLGKKGCQLRPRRGKIGSWEGAGKGGAKKKGRKGNEMDTEKRVGRAIGFSAQTP